jgi:hypothetical protein
MANFGLIRETDMLETHFIDAAVTARFVRTKSPSSFSAIGTWNDLFEDMPLGRSEQPITNAARRMPAPIWSSDAI